MIPQRPIRGHGATAKPPRRYKFACLNCRRKKIHCDGERPECRNCLKALEPCGYTQTSTYVQLRQAQNRIRMLEDRLKSVSPSSAEQRSRCQSLPETLTSPTSEEPSMETDSQEEFFWSQVSIGDDGTPALYGSTSRFHVPLNLDESQDRRYGGVREAAGPKASHMEALRSNAELLRRVWEPLAMARLEFNAELGLSAEVASTLLQIYWTWQHPLHNCVYKPCFLRDMALGGPYFSDLLLTSIYAMAARHANKDDPSFSEIGKGERLMNKVRLLIMAEMSASKPKIPTIQALLILGGRQCSTGNSSEGWLYTGMAIRMLKDIGIHLNAQKLAELENHRPEDLECRKRLYLSAYIWDKSMSLALGRPPSLTDLPHAVDDILDHFDDEDEWKPNFLGGIEKTIPKSKCFTTTTFQAFCRLGEIITQILSSTYGSMRTTDLFKELHELEEKLRAWHDRLDPNIRMENPSKLEFCSPPHIFSLNVAYHAILIVLYRPYIWSNYSVELQQHARSTCISQAVIINDLFLLYGRTYNYRIMTYLVSYCIYTAATINVYEIKFSEDGLKNEAISRLSVSLRVLESEARQTPGIRRSIEIIKQQLSTWNMQSQPLQSRTTPNAACRSLNGAGTVTTSVAPPLNFPEPVVSASSPQHSGFRENMGVAVTGVEDLGAFNWDSMDTGSGFADAFSWTVDDTWIADSEFDILDFPSTS